MKVFREDISSGNIHASNTIINIIQTEQITLVYLVLYMYTYMCVIAINEKGDHEFEKRVRRTNGTAWEGKGRRKLYHLIIISKINNLYKNYLGVVNLLHTSSTYF